MNEVRSMFAKRLILALLIAFFLEITLFNYTHYATLFTSKTFGVMYSEQEQSFISNLPEPLAFDRVAVIDSFFIPSPTSGLKFKNLNTEIASIYINPIFLKENRQRIRVIWADEESSERSINVSIIKGLDFSNYININPCGKISELTVAFLEPNLAIKAIELNKTIPIAFMPIRFVIIGAILFLLFCLKNKEYRKKISYFCFDYLYDKNNRRQKIGFAAFICFALIFNFLVSYSIYGFKDNELVAKWIKMYSHHMTDALLKRQLHLDIEVPKVLVKAEKPYDPKYREQHGMLVNWNAKNLDNHENSLLGDHTYYDGKYYSYFGIVPVVMLFAPYKLVTGHYLPSTLGTFLFASLATVLLLLLWRRIAQNYLNKIPYFFFLTGGIVLYACSFIPIVLVENRFHTIAQFSALAFVIFGVLCLLRANYTSIFLGCLCFALAVGCRPSAIFWSLLVPVLLWDKRREILNIKGLSAIIIPFAVVGSILAWYNYARFGSPFIFGSGYMITRANQMAFPSFMNPIGKLHMVIETFLFVLFNPPSIDVTFPFINQKTSVLQISESSFMYKENIIGIFCFPVMWFLFFISRVKIMRNFIFAGIFISFLSILIFALTGGIVFRYSMDFSWILGLCSLVCAFCLFERHREQIQGRITLKAYYIFGFTTVILVFFSVLSYRLSLSFIMPLDPKIWHYLARTFGVICNVP